MSTNTRWRQRGLTMVELVMFIVIVGIAVVGVLKTLNVGVGASADPLRRKQALLIAEALLEEVESARFSYCDATDDTATTALSTGDCTSRIEVVGPESGNSRPYDNVNDYVSSFGVDATPFTSSGVLTDVNGNSLANGSTSYSAMLKIVATDSLHTITSNATSAGMDVLHITITVTYGTGSGDSITLDGFRTRYAPRTV